MKVAEIIQQCRQEFSDAAEAESLVGSVLAWLSQEHLARQMLVRLPDVTPDPWLQQINTLFANLYGEFSHFVARKNLSADWGLVHDAVAQLPVISAAPHTRTSNSRPFKWQQLSNARAYLEKMAFCLGQLVLGLLAVIKPDETGSPNASAEELSQQLPADLALSYGEFHQVLKSHLRPDVTLGVMQPVGQHNKNVVQEWWFGLEELPPLPQRSQQLLYATLLALPFALQEDQLDRLERLFFELVVWGVDQAHIVRLLDDLPPLLLDAQATENCIWLLAENGFVQAGQRVAHAQLWGHVDMLRCSMPLGVETLHLLSVTLSPCEAPERSAFWELLNLEALTYAAKLAVEQDHAVRAQQLAGEKLSSTN